MATIQVDVYSRKRAGANITTLRPARTKIISGGPESFALSIFLVTREGCLAEVVLAFGPHGRRRPNAK
jgi:hypothetical protein